MRSPADFVQSEFNFVNHGVERYPVGMQIPRKLPRDLNSLAARIVALSSGQESARILRDGAPLEEIETKNKTAIEYGRKGGLKGGKARAAKLTAERRSDIAKIAASARWGKSGN